MKLLAYIWRNVRRNKIRSGLTIMSVGFSLALMTILFGYLTMDGIVQEQAVKLDRVVVLNKLGFASPMPIAHVKKITDFDGIKAATPYSWFGGKYKSQENVFAQFGVEPKTVFEVFHDYEISDDQKEAFQENRLGCVADAGLAEQMKWSIGEKIPLEGTFNAQDLDLTLVGTFKAPNNTGSLWFNWNYLDEELKASNPNFAGNAGSIFAACKDQNQVEVMCEEIDAGFLNSENATQTRTEAAFLQMFSDMLGDVQSYIRFISLAVVFALVLVAGTAMAMSIRERNTEIAVLKAIGFSKTRVLGLILGESTMIAILGGVLGIAGGLGALQLISGVPMAAQLFPIPVSALVGRPWLLGLLGVAAGIGFVSGVVPAVLAAHSSVVDGLRKVV